MLSSLRKKTSLSAFKKQRSQGSILDGRKVQTLMQDEAAFNKYLDNYFTMLDEDKSGKLTRAEMRPALVRFGELLGLPPAGTVAETDAMVDNMFTHLMAEDKSEQIDRSTFIAVSKAFLSAVAEELNDKPVVLQVFDGSVLREVADNQELFSSIVSDFFHEFDDDGSGKLTRSELKPALVALGLIPPDGAKPEMDALVSRILGKYGGSDLEVDKEEFQQMLQDLLKDMTSELEQKPVVLQIGDQVVINGAKLRKTISNKSRFSVLAEDTFHRWDLLKSGRLSKAEVAMGFKNLCTSYNVDLLSAPEAEALCTQVFEEADEDMTGYVERDEFDALLEAMLLKLADRLDKNPKLAQGSAPAQDVTQWFSSGISSIAGAFSGKDQSAPVPKARSADEIKAAYGRQSSGGDATAAAAEAKKKLEQRGEKLKAMSKTADELESEAQNYKDLSAQLAEKMKTKWW